MRYKLTVLCYIFAALFPTITFAQIGGSGSAFIPPAQGFTGSGTVFKKNILYISNVTNSTVTVNIALRDRGGNVLSDDNNQTTGNISAYDGTSINNYTEIPASGTLQFDLFANSTVLIDYKTTANDWGYGTISWTQSGSALKALIASQYQVEQNTWIANTVGTHSVTINSGLPF